MRETERFLGERLEIANQEKTGREKEKSDKGKGQTLSKRRSDERGEQQKTS